MSANPPSESGVFEIARQIQSEEARLQYVDQACGEDEARRARILQLLENDKADSFMERSDLAPEETIDTTAHVAAEGETIGRYKLLQQIGEGGFGVVYMAEQARPVQRKVALKVIKPGMDTKEVIGRFEAERQALAMMDHPNIAKVLDAGTTESQLPFFVMELVRGLPITEYCVSTRLAAQAQAIQGDLLVQGVLLAIESINATRSHDGSVLPVAHETLLSLTSQLGGQPLKGAWSGTNMVSPG